MFLVHIDTTSVLAYQVLKHTHGMVKCLSNTALSELQLRKHGGGDLCPGSPFIGSLSLKPWVGNR